MRTFKSVLCLGLIIANFRAVAADPVQVQSDIVVSARHLFGSIQTDTQPTARLDADAILALGASSVADLMKVLEPMARSADGAEPIMVLNGQRPLITDEIFALPPEAFQRIDLMPEDVATKFGYPPTRNVLNFVTKQRFHSLELRASGNSTTDGGTDDGEAVISLTRIRRESRLSITGSYSRRDPLRQDSRNISPDWQVPFDAIGNVTGIGGAEIDPRLSTLAGFLVTIAPVPLNSAARSSLSGYVTETDLGRTTNLGPYRSLVPGEEVWKTSATIARPIGQSTSASVSFSIEHKNNWSIQGPASATLVVPSANPFTPFSGDVLLQRYLTEVPPLRHNGLTLALHGGTGLQGQIAGWVWNLTGTFDHQQNSTSSEQGIDLSHVQTAIETGDDPFQRFAQKLLWDRLRTWSQTTIATTDAKFAIDGGAIALPAGSINLTSTFEVQRATANTILQTPVAMALNFGWTMIETNVSLTVPITSRRKNFLPFFGDISFNIIGGLQSVRQYHSQLETDYGFTWRPLNGIQLTTIKSDTITPPPLTQLAAPISVVTNTPFLDFVTGQSTLITAFTGGNPDLHDERRHKASISLNVQPISSGPQFSVVYTSLRILNQTGTLSTVTPEIESAFPDLFIRNEVGKLVSADFRPVNLSDERQRTLTSSLSYASALGKTPAVGGRMVAATPLQERPFLFLSLNSTIRLADRLILREGLKPLNLLAGDTIDGSGGKPTLELNGYFGLSYRGASVGVAPSYHGPNSVQNTIPSSDLRFSPLLKIGLSASAMLDHCLPHSAWAHQILINLTVDNLFNERPHVLDGNGRTPNSYQSAYLDPLGRVIGFRIRKLF